MSGYFLIARGLFKHPMFDDGKPLTQREAWIWLIEHANYEQSLFRHKGQMFLIPRGALGASYRSLSEKWRWSVNRVIREVNLWRNQFMVELGTEHGYLHLTVCNYEQYQSPHNANGTPTEQQRNADGTQTDTNQKKGKKVIQEKKVEPPTPCPEWVPLDLLVAFKEMRKGQRAPLTEKAEQLVIAQLDELRKEGHDPTRVLEQSILNGWKGVFPLKSNSKGAPHGRHGGFDKQDYGAGTDGFEVVGGPSVPPGGAGAGRNRELFDARAADDEGIQAIRP